MQDADFDDETLERAFEVTGGSPYFIQELGPEPQKASEVAALLDRESTQPGPTRAELIDMGLLYTPTHGYAAFTVPHFDKFMRRAIPELTIPAKRQRRPPRSTS